MISRYHLNDFFDQEFEVTDELVSDYEKLSNDRNPLHTIDEFAIDKGFNSRVVQGNLQNCFISYFIGECLPSKNVMILTQTIDFKRPVYINDILYLRAKIIGVFESVDLIEFDFKFTNQSGKIISKGIIKIKLI
mgnify:CR=1 FL=1